MYRILFSAISGLLLISNVYAKTNGTERIQQFSNDKVKVWETIIYPSTKQKLAMHRHDKDRVLIALTDGVLKITNDKGKVHFLTLKKDNAYFMPKDAPQLMHNDENVSMHPIKVMLVQLND